MKISSKLKKLGALALVLGFSVTVTTSSFAGQKSDSVDTITKEIEEIFSIEKYLEYVEGIGILNDEEMERFADVQRKMDKIYDEIDAIVESSTNLTIEQQKEIDKKSKQIDELNSSIQDLYKKISPDVEYSGSESFDDLLNDYIEYIDSLGVLSDEEIQKYAEVEREIEKLYKSVEKILIKEDLSKEEENTLEKLYQKVEELHSSVYDIILKIEEAESNLSQK